VILLDTHTLVWLVNEPGQLSVEATAAIRKSDRNGGLAISAITLWELAWLASHGHCASVTALDRKAAAMAVKSLASLRLRRVLVRCCVSHWLI